MRHERRQKRAFITRGLVPLSGQQPGPVEFERLERRRKLLEQAFEQCNDEFKGGYFEFGSLGFSFRWICPEHFSVGPAIARKFSTGNHLVNVFRSVCAEQRAQFLDSLMASKFFTCFFYVFSVFHSFRSFPFFTVFFLFTVLDAVLHHLGQGYTLWSTCSRHQWYQCRRMGSQLFPSSCAVKTLVRNDEGVGSRWSRSVLRHCSNGCGWKT